MTRLGSQLTPGKSFQLAAYILGMGFTFDDTDAKGVAMPLVGDAAAH